MDEDQLTERAAAGDSDAFGSLVAPYLGLFFNGILRILGNRADAQDALQDALLAIFKDLPGFQRRSRFSSWAYKICVNAALMFRRSHARLREESIDAMTGLGDLDPAGHHLDSRESLRWSEEAMALAEAERRQLREFLLQALAALPDTLRMVFVLKDLEDWSTEEIAARLDQTAPAVRQRLHRARLQVQDRLRAHIQGRPS
ncbi:MAG: sigma-70 family RNA polymerase sigma factor [Holophaga sp.]|jgi:RNA polymerase sigma-70 factor (ECF subfamily)